MPMTKTMLVKKKNQIANAEQEKQLLIDSCLNCQDGVNLWELRELALTRGGFVNAANRRVAWCQLVGYESSSDRDSALSSPTGTSADTSQSRFPSIQLPPQELDIIHQDVRRSILFHYKSQKDDDSDDDELPDTQSGESSSQHEDPHQERLAHVLESVVSTRLENGEKFHYYQGLHDVAGVLLIHLDYVDVTTVLRRICAHYLRDATRPDLKDLTWFLQAVLEPVLYQVDAELAVFLQECGVQLTNAVLPWLLTWFAHDIYDPNVACRLMDAFLASHPLLPVYYAIAVLVHPNNRQDVLKAEPDPAMVFMTIRGLLSKITADYFGNDGIPAQDLLDDALAILQLIPPGSLMSCDSIYANDQVQDVDRAASIALLQEPPSWALASWSGENIGRAAPSTMMLSPQDEKLSSLSLYTRAKLASGVDEIMATADCSAIVSPRLEPSIGFATSNGSIRKLTGKVLCQNLRLNSRFPLTARRFANNCLVLALTTRRRGGVYAVVYGWNYDNLFVYGMRQRRSSGAVKILQVCSFQSAFLGYLLCAITFTKALIQVMIQILLNLMLLSIALAVIQFMDTLIRKLYNAAME